MTRESLKTNFVGLVFLYSLLFFNTRLKIKNFNITAVYKNLINHVKMSESLSPFNNTRRVLVAKFEFKNLKLFYFVFFFPQNDVNHVDFLAGYNRKLHYL